GNPCAHCRRCPGVRSARCGRVAAADRAIRPGTAGGNTPGHALDGARAGNSDHDRCRPEQQGNRTTIEYRGRDDEIACARPAWETERTAACSGGEIDQGAEAVTTIPQAFAWRSSGDLRSGHQGAASIGSSDATDPNHHGDGLTAAQRPRPASGGGTG